MLEGLAVWSLFIYLLRLIGIPWNKAFKLFAYAGGTIWLMFVWVGMITWAPMDLSGGSLVQSPHIQLRPGSTKVTGKIKKLHITQNQKIKKGQLVYELEDSVYLIAKAKSKAQLNTADVAYQSSIEEVAIAKENLNASAEDIEIIDNQIKAAFIELKLKRKTLKRYQDQNDAVKYAVTESVIDEQQARVKIAQSQLAILRSQKDKSNIETRKLTLLFKKSELTVKSKQADLQTKQSAYELALWNLAQTKVYAPTDGYVTNFIAREGQFIGSMPRIKMYTHEKYVLMRINHQAYRNIKVGQDAEYTTAIYPGKIFAAKVEGIIEATGEAQGSLMAREENVRTTTGKNVKNKHHFVRLKIVEPEGYNIPVGAVGLAWVNAEKPIPFLNFLNVIRGIIIRMKSQIYFIYSL